MKKKSKKDWYFCYEDLHAGIRVDPWVGETTDMYCMVHMERGNCPPCIVVAPNDDKLDPPKCYFTVFNRFHHEADKMARIKFMTPEYVFHDSGDAQYDWYLNKAQREELLRILHEKSSYILQNCSRKQESVELTTFQMLIIKYNLEGLGIYEDDTWHKRNKIGLQIDLPIPDYSTITGRRGKPTSEI